MGIQFVRSYKQNSIRELIIYFYRLLKYSLENVHLERNTFLKVTIF